MKRGILLLVVAGLTVPLAAYQIGARQAEKRWNAEKKLLREKYKAEAKERADSLKKVASAAVKSLEKDAEARKQDAAKQEEAKAQPDAAAILAERLGKYEAGVMIVPKIKEFASSPYPTWLMKVTMQGTKDDPLKVYHAVFKVAEGHKPTLAARITPGMRLHLELEPFDQQPEALRRLPMLDETDDFEHPVYWVKSFEHDENILKVEESAYSSVFLSLLPEIILRSPQDVRLAGGTYPFYFYGSNWNLFRDANSGKLQQDARGWARHSITHLSRALKEKGIRLIFVAAPLSASVFTDVMMGRDDGQAMKGPAANKPVSDLVKTLRKDGVEVLDATELLRGDRYVDYLGNRYPVCQPNDSHLSSVGTMKLAGGIARMVDPNLSQSAGHDRFKINPEVVQHPSDMLNMVAVKSIRYDMPTMPMLMEKVEGLDDGAREMLKVIAPGSAVHLVGDSQSGIHSQTFAGIHAHLVRELGQSVNLVCIAGSGNNAAMDAWLRSDGITHAKTVVWVVAEAYLDFPGWIDTTRHPRFAAPTKALGNEDQGATAQGR